jgi:hypothetical protein
MESHDLHLKVKRIKSAVARVRSYEAAGKLGEVRRTLAEKNISASTLRNYLKDPKKIETAYRWTEFVEAINRLPDLELAKRNSAYDFALTELGLAPETQKMLVPYAGDYRLFHSFSDIDLNFLAIRTEVDPIVATFVLRYRNRNKSRAECDGLVVVRHGRMFFSGFSRTTIFQGTFRCVAYPDRNAISGMAFIEDMDSSEVLSSSISLLRSGAPAEEERRAREFAEASFQSAA